MNRRKRLGDMLIELNYITENDLQEALKIQKETGNKIGEVLIERGFITEDDLLQALEIQLGIQRIYLDMITVDRKAVKMISESLAKKYNVFPVQFIEGKLLVLMNDPLNIIAEDDVRIASGYEVKIALCGKAEISQAISKYYSEDYMKKTAEEFRNQEKNNEVLEEELSEDIKNAPAVKLVDSIIQNAVRSKASDIHIEPFENRVCVRYRIDGALQKQFDSPKEPLAGLITRIKIMGNMDIAEKRIPQDGRAVMHLRGKDIDMRISTLPTLYGEKVVIRILKRNEETLNRRGIGIPAVEDAKIDTLLGLTSGVIMIVGPTGSGKSSTMYTLIRELLSDRTNLITLEDPVEYHIKGATQVQINEKVGLTFASGLRSVLRQDPDIICVGEIRDGETAEIAMRAAMTGHLVITTIHTEDAISAIDRLRDMGVAPYLIAAGLRGVISQRLLRKICPNCKTQIQPPKKALEMAGIPEIPGKLYWQGTGCDQCFHSGYRGRIGVFEVMLIQEELRRCILEGADRTRFLEVARRTSQYIPMLEHAQKLVEEGVSTVDEIIRTLLAL
mgnify:CR=1 FL=1